MENYQNTSKQISLPLKLSFTLVIGVLLGLGFGKFGTNDAEVRDAGKKYEQVLELIKEHYVDTVNLSEITDEAYSKMFAKLDPHTSYIPSRDLKLVQSQLESDFEGIGVEFNIYNDTLVVVRTIKRGPSEKAGILPGDKIIAVDLDTIAGVGIDNRKVFDLLRGEKGSKVNLLIYRKAKDEFLEIEITRDDIPTFSVEVSYMVDERVGFLKVTRFAENTHNEFKKALIDLKRQGLDRLILDLRNNGGGYMGEAEKMADELLPKKSLIVYTKSKDPHYDHKSYAIKDGLFEDGELIILINENSASASEILAGAIQDNDRGLIVGRRSYGKGLVQRGFQLIDSSEVRITISRYYTPSSRCVQKPYEASIEDYSSDYQKRQDSGELFSADSIKVNDTLVFKTIKNGRKVYGGGGIIPDDFIPKDTSNYSVYLGNLYAHRVLNDFALDYVNANKTSLEKMGVFEFVDEFEVDTEMIQVIVSKATQRGLPFKIEDFKRSKEMIQLQAKALVARGVWGEEGYYRVVNNSDDYLNAAVKLFDKAKAIREGN